MLVDCVHANGMLGNVQPIGADPRHVTSEQTEIYGVGAFLLAGSEVIKLGGCKLVFVVSNGVCTIKFE